MSFWNPVMNAMKSKLSSWKSIFLSIGGRVTMFNFVFANMVIWIFVTKEEAI